MTKQEIINNITKKFTLVGIIDLLQSEKNKSIHKEFRNFKNIVFSKEQRLVVIVDSLLKKTFDDMPVDILKDFQLCLRDNNIAHPFIIILSNIKSIKKDLELVHKIYYYQEKSAISTVIMYNN